MLFWSIFPFIIFYPQTGAGCPFFGKKGGKLSRRGCPAILSKGDCPFIPNMKDCPYFKNIGNCSYLKKVCPFFQNGKCALFSEVMASFHVLQSFTKQSVLINAALYYLIVFGLTEF